jgi:hypothetical protein
MDITTDLTKVTLEALIAEFNKIAPQSDKLDSVKEWVKKGSLSNYSNQDFDMLQKAMRTVRKVLDVKAALAELDKKERHQFSDYDCAAYEHLLNEL